MRDNRFDAYGNEFFCASFLIALRQILRMANEHLPHCPAGPHFVRRVPEGDTTERYVCGDCGHIHYTNPKIVVGSVVCMETGFCCAAAPSSRARVSGHCPPGYLEEHETPEDGARREAPRGSVCDIVLEALLAVYSIPRISQVQLMYRANRLTPEFRRGCRKPRRKAVSIGMIFRGRRLLSPACAGRWNIIAESRNETRFSRRSPIRRAKRSDAR